MTHSNQNGNIVSDVVSEILFSISVNTNLKSNIQVWNHKPTHTDIGNYGINSDKSYSKIQDFTFESFTEFLKQGSLIIPSVLRKSCQLLIFDIDNPSPGEFVSSDYFAWRYPSPSYNAAENCKHRVICVLSRPIPIDEVLDCGKPLYPLIVELMGEDFPLYTKEDGETQKYDECSKKPRQFYWGVKNPDTLEFFPDFKVFDVDAAKLKLQLKYPILVPEAPPTAPPSLSPPNPESLDAQNSDNDNVEETLTTKVYKDIYKKIWIDICKRDFNKFFCKYDHNIQSIPLKPGIFMNGEGRAILSTNLNGNAFWVTQRDLNMPPVFQYRDQKINGSYIYYWYYAGILLGEYPKDMDLKGKNFIKVVTDIYNHFGIEPYKFKKAESDEEDELDSVLEKVRISFVNEAQIYIKKAKWSTSDLYLYYCFKSRVWRLSESFKTIYSECIQYFIDCPENLLLHKKVKGVTQNLLEYSDNLQHIESKLEFDKLRIKEIIPLSNGDFDTRSRKLTTAYSPGICNMTRSGISFRDVDESSKGVTLFNYWLTKQYQLPEQEMVKAWLILNCLGRAIETKRMLNIYGTPNTGKTVLLNLIKSTLGNLALEVNTQNFLLNSNKFASQRLDGIYALLLDEFETDLAGWLKLKNLSGNGSKTIEVERKGLTPYDTLFLAGITTATQDRFFLPNSDDGGIRRRIVLLKHTQDMYREEFDNIDKEFAKPEIYEDIFLWAIQQDGDKALKTFTDYAKTIGKANIKEVILDNDKVLMFMNECLIFTNCEHQDLSNIQIQEAYKNWLFDVYSETLEQNKLAKISQYIREKASIPDNKIDWKFIPEKGMEVKVKRCERYVRGFKGVKFNPSIVDVDRLEFKQP